MCRNFWFVHLIHNWKIYLRIYFSSFIGNLLIIGAVICNKELHTSTNMLVLNLSLADIIISGFVDSFTVAGSFKIFKKSIKHLQRVLIHV